MLRNSKHIVLNTYYVELLRPLIGAMSASLSRFKGDPSQAISLAISSLSPSFPPSLSPSPTHH